MPEKNKINLSALQENFMNEKHKAPLVVPEEDPTDVDWAANILSQSENTPDSTWENKEIQETEKNQKKVPENQVQKKQEDIFKNYQSIFTRERESILQKIKKVEIVKTRLKLVFGLIGCTVIIIAGLFIIDPSKHSLTAYKTSLLQSYDAARWITPPEVLPVELEPTTSPAKIIDITIKNRTFQVYTLVSSSGTTLFWYDGQDFETHQELEAYIEKHIHRLTKEKILQHISEK